MLMFPRAPYWQRRAVEAQASSLPRDVGCVVYQTHRFRRRKQCVQRFLNRTQICSDQANHPNKSPACSIYPRTLLSTRFNMCSGQKNDQTLECAASSCYPLTSLSSQPNMQRPRKGPNNTTACRQFALLLHVGIVPCDSIVTTTLTEETRHCPLARARAPSPSACHG